MQGESLFITTMTPLKTSLFQLCVASHPIYYWHSPTLMSYKRKIPPRASRITNGSEREWKNCFVLGFFLDQPLQSYVFHLHGDMMTWLPCFSEPNPKTESKLFLLPNKGALDVFLISLSLSSLPLLSSFSLLPSLAPLCTQECFVWGSDKRNKRRHWQKWLCPSMCVCVFKWEWDCNCMRT